MYQLIVLLEKYNQLVLERSLSEFNYFDLTKTNLSEWGFRGAIIPLSQRFTLAKLSDRV